MYPKVSSDRCFLCFGFVTYRRLLSTAMNTKAGVNKVWPLNCAVTPLTKFPTERWHQVLSSKG